MEMECMVIVTVEWSDRRRGLLVSSDDRPVEAGAKLWVVEMIYKQADLR